MKRTGFTLIELLVVIAIIAILAALLMPAITTVRNNAKKAQARAQMNAIMTAIKTYESTYGVLPIPAGYSNATSPYYLSISDNGQYEVLMELLTGVKKGSGGVAITNKNSRSIRFLDVPTGYTLTDNTKNGYRDPWSNYYYIYMDSDYAGDVVNAGPANNETLYGTVFIYSTAGPASSTDKYIYTWK